VQLGSGAHTRGLKHDLIEHDARDDGWSSGLVDVLHSRELTLNGVPHEVRVTFLDLKRVRQRSWDGWSSVDVRARDTPNDRQRV